FGRLVLVRLAFHWIAPVSLTRRSRSFCAEYSSGVCPEDAAISSSSRVSGARCECALPVVIDGTSRVGGADIGTDCRGGGAEARGAGAGGLLSIGLCCACPLLGRGLGCSRNPSISSMRS